MDSTAQVTDLPKADSSKTELTKIDSLWDYNDPAKTEQIFRELLTKAESSADKEYLLELQTQIARTLSLQRRFEEAHKLLDEIKPELEKYPSPLVEVRYNLERGRSYNSDNKQETSREYFLKAWEISKANKLDYFAVDAAHMLGICEKGDKSLEWNDTAIAYAEQSSDTRAKGWLGALYNNTGWTYHDLGNYTKAYDYFERDYHWYKERGKDVQARIAQWAMARTLRSMGKYEEALQRQYDLEKAIEEAKAEQDGYVSEEIGENLLSLNRAEEATPYFAQAYQLLSNDIWLKANEVKRLERLKQLGKVE